MRGYRTHLLGFAASLLEMQARQRERALPPPPLADPPPPAPPVPAPGRDEDWWAKQGRLDTATLRRAEEKRARKAARAGARFNWSCPKCGKQFPREDAVTDQGTGAEAGRTFNYCSQHCKETH